MPLIPNAGVNVWTWKCHLSETVPADDAWSCDAGAETNVRDHGQQCQCACVHACEGMGLIWFREVVMPVHMIRDEKEARRMLFIIMTKSDSGSGHDSRFT